MGGSDEHFLLGFNPFVSFIFLPNDSQPFSFLSIAESAPAGFLPVPMENTLDGWAEPKDKPWRLGLCQGAPSPASLSASADQSALQKENLHEGVSEAGEGEGGTRLHSKATDNASN